MIYKRLFCFIALCFCAVYTISVQADPEIVVDPLVIETDLLDGEREALNVNIANVGDEDLQFTINHEIIDEPDRDSNMRSARWTNRNGQIGPRRDDLGDEIAEFDVGRGEWWGLAWDGELMWGIGGEQGMIAFDPEEEEVVENVNLNGSYIGMAYDGESFWTGAFSDDDEQAIIQRLDREGNVNQILNVQGMVVYGVAYDGENLWYYSIDWEEDMFIRQITTEGEQLTEIDCSEIFEVGALSLAWVPEHEDGNLWVIAWNDRRIYQLDISEDDPEVLQEARINGGEVFGLEHDGENMWYCTVSELWYVIDDGITEVRWLLYEPVEGVIEPDESIDVNVIIDATGLFEGVYETDLHILSNDPENDDVVVRIRMHVTGIPVIDVTWSEEIGYPDRIDWNEAYIDLFTGEAYQIPVTIQNVGTAPLIVGGISCDNEVFRVDNDNFELEPDDEIEVSFILETEENGEYESEMIIAWNSPDEEDFIIPLRGETAGPPAIIVDPAEFHFDLNTGDVDQHTFNLSNEGESALRFGIEYEIISEPDRDRNQRSLRQSGSVKPIGPRRDDLGDIIDEFNVGARGWTGLAWDGELMWGISDRRRMVAFDPEAEEIVEEMNIDETYFGMTFDGEFFWVGTSGGDDRMARILRIDRNGDVNRTIDSQGWVVGITFDGENLWYYRHDFEHIVFRQISLDGELLREVECRGIIEGRTFSIAWVPEHDNDNLWVLNWATQTLHQLDVSGDEAEQVQETQINGLGNCLEHDGANMWYGALETWYMIDDGIAELSWLSCDPEGGELEPDDEIEVEININAEGLWEGGYEAEIHILSNDPENEDVVVSILLNVTGAPVIEVIWSDDFGCPDIVDWNRAYLDLFIGVPYTIPITIHNDGTSDLVVDDIVFTEDVFSVDSENFVLEPEEEVNVDVTLETIEDGVYESEMTIIWNSPNEDETEYVINLTGETAAPPVIEIEPGSIEADMYIDESEEFIINISNIGESNLRFVVECEIIAEPEHDQVIRSDRNRETGPRRDDLGDVISEFNVLRAPWSGLAWDGEFMWGITTEAQMAAFDPENEQMVETVNLDRPHRGLTYDGEFFWVGSSGGDDQMSGVLRIDRNGDLHQTIEVQGWEVTGVAFDGENLWYYSINWEQEGVFIRQMTPDGEHLRQVNCSNILQGEWISLAWIPEHEDGNLWVISRNQSTLYQLDVSDNDPEIIQETQINEYELYGLEHDGENMWYSTPNGVWYVIDDGITEVSWLTYDPDEGELDPDCDMDVMVEINTEGLIIGQYEADLHFDSNDPENPNLVINVMINIETTGVPEDTPIPQDFSLSRVWPNPFNAMTRIGYTLPTKEQISIKVYDVYGHLVSTLFDGEQTAGEHLLTWNSQNIPTGIYLVRMKAGAFHMVRRATLLK
ncbi:MAG: T9SS type A sorting domain-containing protein [Candidatus Hatepunaea meridiana]|nr:T9SS type A sorting domain-containing protein [Candidatus Hatepunaea meridiana]